MRTIRLLTAVKIDEPFICGDKNDILTVTEPTGQYAVNQRLAVWHGATPATGPSRSELEQHEAMVAAAAQAAGSAGTLQKMNFPPGPGVSPVDPDPEPAAEERVPEGIPVNPDPADVTEDDGDAPKRPYGNAPKSAWIRYACAVDPEMTEERGEGMTKADLMSKYGERL